MLKKVLPFFALTVLLGATLHAEEGKNLLNNADFAKAPANGKLPGWHKATAGKWKIIDLEGAKVLELSNDNPAHKAIVSQNIKRDPSWKYVRFTAKVWVKSVEVGKKGWQTPQIGLTCYTAEGKPAWPALWRWKKPTDGWVTLEKTFRLKDSLVRIDYGVAVLQCKGVMLVKDMSFEVASEPKK